MMRISWLLAWRRATACGSVRFNRRAPALPPKMKRVKDTDCDCSKEGREALDQRTGLPVQTAFCGGKKATVPGNPTQILVANRPSKRLVRPGIAFGSNRT